MVDVQDLQTYVSSTIPNALSELSQSHKNIEQIALYCKNAYAAESDQNAVFLKTQNYIKDALSNVAYHIQNVSQHVNNFLVQQAKEISKLELQIQTVTDRLKVAHDGTGSSGFKTADSIRPYQKRLKMTKLDVNELPAVARPVTPFVRTSINLKGLDNVGIDLQGNKGGEYISTMSAVAPELLGANSGPSNAFRGPPRGPSNVAPPPPPLNAPPPPLLGRGISSAVNNNSNSNNSDAPPPPPPLGIELPPPPPPFEDVPPPPPLF